jgi:hypothetical protein
VTHLRYFCLVCFCLFSFSLVFKNCNLHLVAGFFSQFCQVGGLAIIHQRTEPKLARGWTGLYKMLGILPTSSDVQELTI